MEPLATLGQSLSQTLDHQLANVWQAQPMKQHLQQLAEGIAPIKSDMVQIGEEGQQGLAEGQAFPHYWMNFEWPDQAKSFLILWRDTLFQQQKALIQHQEGRVSESQLEQLRTASEMTVKEAAASLKALLQTQAPPPKQEKKQVNQWKLQQNPWPIYRDHMHILEEQSQALYEDYLALSEVVERFDEIHQAILTLLGACTQERYQFQTFAEETLAFIDRCMLQDESPKPGKIVTRLEDLEEWSALPHHFNVFSGKLESILSKIPDKLSVPVELLEGQIACKDIAFPRSVRQWLESKIIPQLYEVWELTENRRSRLKMSLINIHNRALLLSNELKETKTLEGTNQNLGQPLHIFIQEDPPQEIEFERIKALVKERIEREFRVSQVYDLHEDFLPVSLQSTLKSLTYSQNEWLDKALDWFRLQLRRLQQFRRIVEEEESLSDSEKLVRYVKSKQTDSDNNAYTNIFLTRGYIGESFWVGREKELTHIETQIQNWKSGFRGSLIISGQRFSGKSLFGELIANRFFYQRTIRLRPSFSIHLEGRKFTPTYNLQEALEFVRKYANNTKPLVWIDDLELWTDPQIPLSQNIRSLRRHLDNYPSTQFVLVSMSNWLKHHLDRYHYLDKTFHSYINLDRMTQREVHDAILIRHGSTHKTLVDENGIEVNSNQFQKMVSRIHKLVHGNIGEALNRWTQEVVKVDERRIMHQPRSHPALPEFLDPDLETLLTSIMMQKRTNEYRLRKVFGPPFHDKYRVLLQQMVGLGLLTRHLDGWLEVHEASVNELGRLLDQRKALHFYR